MRHANPHAHNRTGIHPSSEAASIMQAFADEQSPEPEDTPESAGIAALRSRYVSEAEGIGSVPHPGDETMPSMSEEARKEAKAKGKAAVQSGRREAKTADTLNDALLDKLGERLAFERSGVRLYQALIDKLKSLSAGGGVSAEAAPIELGNLEHIRDEELQHMRWLDAALKSLDADPTAQTPGADVAGVASAGIMQVLTDPHTDLPQCLSAVLSAELTDHAGWDLLIQLTEKAGHEEFLDDFRQAREHEEEHLEKVQGWLAEQVVGTAI